MAKGSRGGKRGGASERVNPANISNVQDLISQRERNQTEVDETLVVLRDMYEEYGVSVDTYTAEIGGKDASVLAFCDQNGDITINANYFAKQKMDKAMEDSVKSGFHPSLGNKTGIESVASHEFGHTLTLKIADNLSKSQGKRVSMDEVSARIVTDARKITGDRGNVIFGGKISKYATHSNAETIAEAICDVYCNGTKAKAQSKAIKSVLDKYLK